MKKIFLPLICLLAAISISAEDKVLMTIDGKPIMASEFTYIYEKNNQETTVEKKSLDEYLDLFINFKLKVTEAELQGLDTTETFKKELAGYRAQATPKYMKDEEAIDSLIRMTYDHICKDRRAAHIAIKCPMSATPEEEAIALAKIKEARLRVTEGLPVKKGKKTIKVAEPFDQVAREVSNDPNAQENGGELGWITPLRYVYAFEQAVYDTPVGEVTPIFRSGFGFHIALIEEERDHQEVRASHIMKMVPRGNEEAAAEAKIVIDSIYARLMAGEDFAEVARQCSDDKGSAMRGGDLDWFSRGMMVKAFEQTAFSLPEGTISEPVRSEYGWHIILQNGKRNALSLEEMRPQLEKSVSRDERMKEADKSFLNKARKEYQLAASMSDEEVRQYVDEHLEDKYVDLKNLVHEYHDGILLFDVSLKEVWDKASQDKEGLTNYFKAHKKDFTWEKPRYKGYVLYCKDAATAKAAKAIVKSANADSVQSYLNQRINLDSITYVKATKGMWEKGQNAAVDQYGFKVKGAKADINEELPIILCVGKVLKNPEEYMDERGKVTTAYQDELEKIWVANLRKKHQVVVNEDVFNEIKQAAK